MKHLKGIEQNKKSVVGVKTAFFSNNLFRFRSHFHKVWGEFTVMLKKINIRRKMDKMLSTNQIAQLFDEQYLMKELSQ